MLHEQSQSGANSAHSTATPASAADPRQYLKDEPTAHRVQRDDDRDLAFTGWLLGKGTYQSGKMDGVYSEREVTASIYRTIGGKYIVHVLRTWQFRERWTEAAEVCADGAEVLAVLTSMNDGKLGSASRDAWNAACDKDPALAPFAVETID